MGAMRVHAEEPVALGKAVAETGFDAECSVHMNVVYVDFRQRPCVSQAVLPLPIVVLVCHSRERSLDMTSPALRLCMETARAVLALASRPWEAGQDAARLDEV